MSRLRSLPTDGSNAAGSSAVSVLHISQPGSEGVGNAVRDLALSQTEAGLRVGIACPPDSPLMHAADRLGIPAVSWRAQRSPGSNMVREFRELLLAVERFRPDIVHLHSSKAGLIGRLALRRRLPTVFQPHAWSFEAAAGAVRPVTTAWERLAARWTDAIVTVSEGERELAARWSILAGTTAVISNPVDVERFHPPTADDQDSRQIRRSLGFSDEPIVACTGRLSHQKGQDLLLQAWPAVLAKVPTAQLLLIGDGPYRSQLETQRIDNVHFLGNRADVAEILRAVQVVVMPSRWEGMSLAMLEAMASAKPVVISDVGGTAETIGRGAGEVVPVGQVDALAAATLRRLIDSDLAAEEGQRGRDLVLANHTASATVQSVNELYQQILSSRGSHRRPPAILGRDRSVDV